MDEPNGKNSTSKIILINCDAQYYPQDFFLGAKIVGRIAEKGGQVGAHHCKVAGTSKVFRKRKPTTSRRQSQTQAEKRFKEGEQHNGFSDTDFIF